MSVFLCITIIFLTFFGSDLRVSAAFDADAANNEYFIKLYFFGISILRITVAFVGFDVKNRYLRLRLNKKEIGIALTSDRTNKDSILNYMSNPLIGAIDFRYFDFTVIVGAADNAFLSAMALQVIKSIYFSFVAVIKNKQDLDTDEKFIMDYVGNNVKLRFYGIISLTPANIIFSLLIALSDKISAAIRAKEAKIDYKYRSKTHRKGNGQRLFQDKNDSGRGYGNRQADVARRRHGHHSDKPRYYGFSHGRRRVQRYDG